MLASVSLGCVTTSLLLDLTHRYQESQRHYHTLEHVAAMLHQGRQFPLDDEQIMAIWFHDAVYDPASDQNEQKSARLASKWLAKCGWEVEAIERVGRMVLDTRGHMPSTLQAEPVLDLDLMSLAVSWPAFEMNTAAIRAEYCHVPDDDFAAGRRKFFTSMLERNRLFFTPWGATLEAAARANLRRAINELAGA
ncbi:MAG: putative metal-dependent HD superfamily phosphohydrolase [Hyphomicrobiaceae bacterium]